MPTHISLPNERVEQLRMIAKAKNITIPEVIAGYVRADIEAGVIPADIPGIDVIEKGAEIRIEAGDFIAQIPTVDGPTIANLLREAGQVAADPERKRRWVEGLAGLAGVKLKRAGGNGLKVVSPITGRELPLSLDIAADLGERIARKSE